MKIITLWQPWATLIALGLKQYETRSWGTDYRGAIAIHAAKRPMGKAEYFTWLDILKVIDRDTSNLPLFDQLPLGAIVATAELDNCQKMTDQYAADPAPHWIHIGSRSNLERRCGDWQPGRYAWHLSNVEVLKDPMDHKGERGLRDLPLEIAEKVTASELTISRDNLYD